MVKIFFYTLLFSALGIIYGQNGIIKTYYPNGTVESRVSFIEGVLEGSSFWYFENGNKKTEKVYLDGKLDGIIKEYYASGLLKKETHFANGILDGIEKFYYDNGSLKFVKTYNKGELLSRKDLNYDSLYIAPLSLYEAGRKKNIKSESDFICGLEICPEPVGGIKEIEDKIIYPELARQYKLEGNVLVTATINKRGIPKNIKILKGLGLGCDEAAINAVKKTNFIPGINNGSEEETEVTFNLNFKLAKQNSQKINKINNFVGTKEEHQHNNENVVKEFVKCDAEICPIPIGGISELLSKLRYPSQAKRNNISGDVIVKARVNDLGFVIKAEVVKGIGYGCDRAAISAVIKTQFEPGKANGVDLETDIEIIVPFILDGK